MLKVLVAVLAAAALAACWSYSSLGAMDAHVWSGVCWIVSGTRRLLMRWWGFRAGLPKEVFEELKLP